MDEVITPQAGNATIFARYVDPGYATQIILTGRLTRFYERRDWAARIKGAGEREPMLLERGLILRLSAPQKATTTTNFSALEAQFEAIFQQTQAMPRQERQQAGDDLLAVVAPHHAAFNASLSDLRK